MERLQGIVTRPHRLRPAQSSKVRGRPIGGPGWEGTGIEEPLMTQSPVQIASDHRAEFARCLEPLLLLGPRRAASTAGGANT